MRVEPVLVLCAALQHAARSSAQTQPRSAATAAAARSSRCFAGGVDLLTVDATVVDREGRQITDLTAADFTVEVDGDAASGRVGGVRQARRRHADARRGETSGGAADRPGRSVFLDQHARG